MSWLGTRLRLEQPTNQIETTIQQQQQQQRQKEEAKESQRERTNKEKATKETKTNMESSREENKVFRVLCWGLRGAGTTSLIKRYIHQIFSYSKTSAFGGGTEFALKSVATSTLLNFQPNSPFGSDASRVTNLMVHLEIWDAGITLASQPVGTSLSMIDGCILTIDSLVENPLMVASRCRTILRKELCFPTNKIPIVIAFTKADARTRALPAPIQLDTFCYQNSFVECIDTSSLQGTGIESLFSSLIRHMLSSSLLDPLSGSNNDTNEFHPRDTDSSPDHLDSPSSSSSSSSRSSTPDLGHSLRNINHRMILSQARYNIIPDWLFRTSYVHLRELSMSDCQLTSVSANLAFLQNLATIDFSHNQLHSLPDIFDSFDYLINIKLSDNFLQFIPHSLGTLAHTRKINIDLSTNPLLFTFLPTSSFDSDPSLSFCHQSFIWSQTLQRFRVLFRDLILMVEKKWAQQPSDVQLFKWFLLSHGSISKFVWKMIFFPLSDAFASDESISMSFQPSSSSSSSSSSSLDNNSFLNTPLDLTLEDINTNQFKHSLFMAILAVCSTLGLSTSSFGRAVSQLADSYSNSPSLHVFAESPLLSPFLDKPIPETPQISLEMKHHQQIVLSFFRNPLRSMISWLDLSNCQLAHLEDAI